MIDRSHGGADYAGTVMDSWDARRPFDDDGRDYL
jgi:hypothetical protein